MESIKLILIQVQLIARLLLGQKKVLNLDEASLHTGLSKSFLYKMTSTSKIPHYCPSGKVIFFKKQELDAWCLQNRRSTDEEIAQQATSYCTLNKKGGKR